ncbi:hypothetical protein H0H92_009697 [Tricholoma furcatifolium]|nr:hypothetical protein H0H92_009697 [Tricholoma furcatifolium]
MSASPEQTGTEPGISQPQNVKKRRIPGACDHCKKKKSDSAEAIGNRCSNCVQYNLECTHKEVSKTLGSAKGYVESLETRLEKMEKLLHKLMPNADLTHELENLDGIESPSEPTVVLPRNDVDILEEELVGKLKRLHVDPPQGRFFGQSSGYQLIQTALDIRSEYIGKWQKPPVLSGQRAHFWFRPPWHPLKHAVPPTPAYTFPDTDLLHSLVTEYFEQINNFLPLLHRPSFERSVATGLHHRDTSFGGTLLLVCALGSRYSNDPRVLYDGISSPHSAGWKWFEQVSVVRESFIPPPSLSELQNYALAVLFSSSSETPQGCWTQLGTAIRMAQEVGAHRRRTLKAPTAEDELWKRAFWVLNSLDRLLSSYSGRQCALQVEDHDVDLPIECDDEYWDHPDPALAFKQPPDRPSAIAYFNCYIKLVDILAYTMRAIYPVNKLTPLDGQAMTHLDQKTVMDLDSALNNWMDSLPEHLRWNPNMTNQLFLKQSATLYAKYYHLQILVHRPFIPSFRNKSTASFPSLAICSNAARSCCHVLDIQSRTTLPFPTLQITVFTAAVVLLLNIWSGKRSGVAPYPQREMEDVKKCMNLLKTYEQRWCSAGRYRRDILMELASAGDMGFSRSPSTPEVLGTKRPRDCDASQFSNSQFFQPFKDSRKLSSSRRASTDPLPEPLSVPAPSPLSAETVNFELPIYGRELGQLPIYGQFTFSELDKRPRREPDAPVVTGVHPFSRCGEVSGINDPSSDILPPGGLPSQMNGYAVPSWNPYNGSQNAGGPAMSPMFYQDQPAGTSMDGVPLMDIDTLAMWSTAPTGFEYVPPPCIKITAWTD